MPHTVVDTRLYRWMPSACSQLWVPMVPVLMFASDGAKISFTHFKQDLGNYCECVCKVCPHSGSLSPMVMVLTPYHSWHLCGTMRDVGIAGGLCCCVGQFRLIFQTLQNLHRENL